jgi:hypothetical protein
MYVQSFSSLLNVLAKLTQKVSSTTALKLQKIIFVPFGIQCCSFINKRRFVTSETVL